MLDSVLCVFSDVIYLLCDMLDILYVFFLMYRVNNLVEVFELSSILKV